MRTFLDDAFVGISVAALLYFAAEVTPSTPIANETVRLQRLETQLTYRAIQHASIGDVDLASEVQE